MNKIKNIVTILLFCLCFCSIELYGQNNTNSPYTRFGYGRLANEGFGRTAGMGGIGFGFRTKNAINPLNPAAYSCIDSTSFLFELGFSGLLSTYSTSSVKASKLTGNIDYLGLQFPVKKWLGISAGIIPYSFSGYNFQSIDSVPIPSNNKDLYLTKNEMFSGQGGISQLYFGLSFDVLKRLSLGINGYYMFGTISNYRYFGGTRSDQKPSYETMFSSELRVNSFNTRFGLQYRQPMRQNKDMLTIGAIYEYKKKLNSQYYTIASTASIDTIYSDTVSNYFQLPNVYGLGFTYILNNKIQFGADALFQQFGSALFANKKDSLNNNLKISAGIEYINKPNGNRYIDRVAWRFGGNYSSSYFNINNKSVASYAITAGVGFPFKTIKSVLNINFEYGGLGTKRFDMIREDYFKIGVNFTLNETWFVKPKIK